MAKDEFSWPLTLLKGCKIPKETLQFLESYAVESEKAFYRESELTGEIIKLEVACEDKDRYISELEKQISILRKTLDLIYKNGGGEDG